MQTKELETAYMWVEFEDNTMHRVLFARIPQGWANKLDQHPQDDEIYYWCDDNEWLNLGAGETLGDSVVLGCACDECEAPNA